jgi:hypothetical protein
VGKAKIEKSASKPRKSVNQSSELPGETATATESPTGIINGAIGVAPE